MNVNMSFPLRNVGGAKWFALATMGIKRLDVVAYRIEKKEQFTFAGGHRHRLAVAHDDIHILFPSDSYSIPLDIGGVAPPQAPKRRHGQR